MTQAVERMRQRDGTAARASGNSALASAITAQAAARASADTGAS